jgi:hypothetical protein
MNNVPLETLTLATFAALLHTRFQVERGGQQSIELELVEATFGGISGAKTGDGPRYENFSLMFHGEQSQPLGQGTFSFSHPQIGRFELFIVPIAAQKGKLHYQAVFNRLVTPS